MEKIYSENSLKNIEKREPKEETVNFLLNYSKALNVKDYNNMRFETLLN
ncbi:hypothetical protein [Algibacter pectinivorans]|uniref:Uncharacterized protein n=1 Tax=Algibacter pectinivorans TaxID=870482 RepID=A0A1I1PBW0_9FLAO|nr:hypothetical protein [Algibacter pectinivorans]SFD07205.1 hypothetical protein SAMN04487987_103362 [Algibacter pectinivorans]